MCAEIFESIHSDYRALEIGELMRGTTDPNAKNGMLRKMMLLERNVLILHMR